jgi:hypothetical protein
VGKKEKLLERAKGGSCFLARRDVVFKNFMGALDFLLRFLSRAEEERRISEFEKDKIR